MDQDQYTQSDRVDIVRPLTRYHFRPKTGYDHSVETFVEPQDHIAEAANVVGFTAALQEYKDAEGKLSVVQRPIRDAEYPKIVFLGTGSCIPNKTRNVSAILVHLT